MLRLALLLLLLIFVARAFWRVVDGLIEGVTGRPPARGRAARGSAASVQMQRDPVCGTFVVPENAIVVTDGSRRLYFCSDLCREQYRARRSAAHGRTA